MITMNKRLEIKKILETFENKVKSYRPSNSPSELPSIKLWHLYDLYLDEILNLYLIEENEKEFIELFIRADIDHMYVDAYKSEEEMKSHILSYIERMKKEFRL